MAIGDPESAGQAAHRAAEFYPDQPLAHLAHGNALLAVGHTREAADALRHAVYLDPQSAPAQRLLGVALAAAGQFREAVQAMEVWARLEGKPPEEEAESPMVERIRAAAMTMNLVLKGARD
jgi:cytochrome c-type biogenesis protein CcmH/NrfG